MEQVLDLVKELSEELKELGVDNYEERIVELQEKVDYCDRQIENGISHIKKYSKDKREHILSIKAYKNATKGEKDYSSDIQAILEHPTVLDMEVNMEEGKFIYIYTDYIDIFDEDGNRFKGGKYMVEFNFDKMSVKFFGQDTDYIRESCWGENCPHPHVNEEGVPCLGDAGSMLAISMNDYELYASYIIALNFLQQVNVNDGAGEYIYNWDCIDEDGNIIENPYESHMVHCCDCNERMHEDDAYRCAECGDWACNDHAWYAQDLQDYICQGCKDNSFSTCDNCSDIYNDENIIRTADESYYCEECLESLGFKYCDSCGEYHQDTIEFNGERYCQECYEDNIFMCKCCKNDYHNDYEYSCSKCGNSFCEECFNHEKDMCDDCVEESEEK